MCNGKVKVLYLSISILWNLILLLHYISEVNVVLFKPLYFVKQLKLLFAFQITFLPSENHISPDVLMVNVYLLTQVQLTSDTLRLFVKCDF